jgi:hypothetical protein
MKAQSKDIRSQQAYTAEGARIHPQRQLSSNAQPTTEQSPLLTKQATGNSIRTSREATQLKSNKVANDNA